MRTRNLLLTSLLVALYGCQPETPVQSSLPVEPAAPTAMTPASASVEALAPAPTREAAPVVVQEKPAIMKEKAAAEVIKPAPAQAVIAPTAQIEAAPTATTAAVTAVPAKIMLSETDALALAKKNGCLICHAIDKKMFGPAWKDVAAKYRGNAGAEDRLADKIAKGGGGVWGSGAMPPNPKVSEADRRALASFVLSLK